MRSIGKIRIRKLKKIINNLMIEYTKETNHPYIVNSDINFNEIEAKIKNQIPLDWYNTWEMASQEIDRLINDIILDYKYMEKLI